MDRPSSKQVTEVVMLVDDVDTIQENMEVDIVTSAVVGPRWNKWRQKTPTSISDKSKSEGDYWANKMLVSGVGEEDVPPQQHHLQGGDVAGQHHQLPGHVDRSKLVHMKEIPGKLKLIPNLIVTLPGSSAQAENGGAGDVRGVQVGQGGGHHGHEDEAGQGEQSDQHGHQSDGGPVAEQHRRDGGQMDSVNNMVKASMIETTGSNKFRVMFGMMEGEVEWLKRRRVFLLGLGVGMELHHRREVIGGGRAGFLMAWSRGGSTSFLLVWGRNWVEGILKKILGVVERESGRSQQPRVVM